MKDYARALQKIRSICLALPEGAEVQAWGHPTFRAGKKMFAAFGDLEGQRSLGLKVGFDRQEELLKDERFFPTPYAAHQGWVSLRVDDKTDWDEVKGLLEEAYRQIALKRMLKELERRQRPWPWPKNWFSRERCLRRQQATRCTLPLQPRKEYLIY